jgi:hypothetical protein
LAPLHASTFGSNLHARVLKIMPSLTPSVLVAGLLQPVDDHLLVRVGERLRRDRLAGRVLRRHLFSATATERVARFEKPVRMAGAPAMTPSKYVE